MKTDLEIQDDVSEEIRWDPRLADAELGAVVVGGVVTLVGSVPSYAAREAAAEAALGVAGVRGVANEIVVDLPSDGRRSDAALTRAALDALRWDVLTPDERVIVTVQQGWVSLDGEVDWEYQRNAAEGTLRNLTGLRGLTNRIRVTDRDRAGAIRRAAER